MRFFIIGLGNFGTHLTRQLTRDGHEIVAVDNNPAHVAALKDEIEYIIQADCTDLSAFHEIAQILVPAPLVGTTLQQVDLRGRYDLNLVTVAKGRGAAPLSSTRHPIHKVLGIPQPTRDFEADDILVLFGQAKDIRRMMKDYGKHPKSIWTTVASRSSNTPDKQEAHLPTNHRQK
jgi:Trk K+ transport system NAD-binding subunit